MTELIQAPKSLATKLVKGIFYRLEFIPDNCCEFKQLVKVENELINQLDKRLRVRRELYPSTSNLSKIRFTESELNDYFNDSCQTVSQAVPFQGEAQIVQATKLIWTRIFGNSEVLKPIKQSDWRFCLDKDVSSDQVYHLVTDKRDSPMI